MMVAADQVFTPQVLWAQRANEVYITIALSDVQNPELKLEENKVHFKGTSDNKMYLLDLPLYDNVDVQTSVKSISPRLIFLNLKKAKKDEAWWPRLLSDSQKPHWLKTDFARWKDEDDEDDDVGMGNMGGMDFSKFANMASMGGMSDEADFGHDSDDEDLPEGEEELAAGNAETTAAAVN